MAKTGFKNVYICRPQGRLMYRGQIVYKQERYSKDFNTPEEAAKYVDLKCIEFGIPQRNNSFKQK